MANGRRPIPPLRAWTAAVLGVFALFVISAGAGMTSWSIVALGLALMILAVSLVVVSAMRGGPKAYIAGTAHVMSASEPPSSSRYGRCEMGLVVDAPGLASARITHTDLRVPVAKWPDPGSTLPIMVAADDQRRIRILWDDVPTFAEAAAEEQFLGYAEEYTPPPPAEPVLEPTDLLDVPLDAPTPPRPAEAATEYDEPTAPSEPAEAEFHEAVPTDQGAPAETTTATATDQAEAAGRAESERADRAASGARAERTSAGAAPAGTRPAPRPTTVPADHVDTESEDRVRPAGHGSQTRTDQAEATPADRVEAAPADHVDAAPDDHVETATADQAEAIPADRVGATPADHVETATADQAEPVAAAAEQDEPAPADRRKPAIVDMTVEPLDPYATDFYPVEEQGSPTPSAEPAPAAAGAEEEAGPDTQLPRPRPRPRRPRPTQQPTNAAPPNGAPPPRTGAMTAAAQAGAAATTAATAPANGAARATQAAPAAGPTAATGTAVADPEPAEETANGGPRVTAIEIDLGELITAYPSARPGPGGTIHGVGITVLVRDLARSVAFYRDMLGFYEIDGGEGNAVLASGDTRVVLRVVHDAPAVNRRTVHLNLEVGDVQAVYEELKAKGVRFIYAPRPVNRGERLELWAAAFRDPDGHGIAITQWRTRA